MEPVILEIRKLSSVADYLFICGADSERQVQAIADNIDNGMRKLGERPLGVEGAKEGKWALIDCNDVIAHVFLKSIREFYDLEGLWTDAPVVEVKEDAASSDKPTDTKKAPKKGAAAEKGGPKE